MSYGIWSFLGDHPYAGGVLLFIVALMVEQITNVISNVINRSLRHRTIRTTGWPPEHCDADGDFKPQEKEG